MLDDLASRECLPCKGQMPPLEGEALKKLQQVLDSGWKVVDEHHLEKEYKFPNFITALHFTNQIGEIAEKESHHPDIYLSWGKVGIKLWTHKIDGLTENDFILAAKVEKIPHS